MSEIYGLFDRNKRLVAKLVIPGGKQKAENTARRLARRSNIFAGFRDDEGIFHPIRASADYSPRRVGERPKAKRKAKKRRKNPKRPAGHKRGCRCPFCPGGKR